MPKKPPRDALLALFNAEPDVYKNDPEADGYNSTQAIARALTADPQIDNPEPQGRIPKPAAKRAAALEAMFDAVSKTFNDVALAQLGDALDAGNFAVVLRWAKIGLARGKINQAAYDAVVAEIDATVPDPAWKAKISGKCPLATHFKAVPSRGISLRYIGQILGRRQ